MPLTEIISNGQIRVKDSFAGSPSVGLALRANGEEKVKVIDARGNVYDAFVSHPTVAPSLALGSAVGLQDTYFYSYIYVYASSLFPFVENALAVNGKVYPMSRPSAVATLQITGGDKKIVVTVTKTTDPLVTTIWIFRTSAFATLKEAKTAAQGGFAYFVGEIVNDGIAGTEDFTDSDPVDSADQVEIDNYECPQFCFTVFYDPYWWGFGNLPFEADCTWDNTGTGATGLITLTDPLDFWFDGRDGQNVTIEGLETGGYDGFGVFKFKWLSATTAGVTEDGTTLVPFPEAGGTSRVTIQGPATTLYRSKARNPFSWGLVETVGNINVPRQYAFKVGGGLASALAVVPNAPMLKLDTEYPAKCYTLNLRAAGTDSFESTLRVISDVHSVSAHFSQFPAVTAGGGTVLWGIDYKNFAILQCDGVSQVPISTAIPKILRSLTSDRTKQIMAHGCYDARTELNCIWVTTKQSLSLVNYLIYQHAPTGFWGFCQEHDVLCSASIQDTKEGSNKTFVGTESGFLGQAFVKGVYNNWLPLIGGYTGQAISATANSITIAEEPEQAFNTEDAGMVGNWVLITNAEQGEEQWARISEVTDYSLTFDLVWSYLGGDTTQFDPVPVAGAYYYIGLIEARLFKYFDLGVPQTDKQLLELWLNQEKSEAKTFLRFYQEFRTDYEQFVMLQNTYGANNEIPSNMWVAKDQIPAELVKMFGIEIINRSYLQWRLINMVLKPRIAP